MDSAIRMRFIKVVVVFGLSVSFCMAAQISISGVVKDSVTGAPINTAIVRLLHNAVADTTDTAGAFTLTGQTAVMGRGPHVLAPSAPVLSAQGEMFFTLGEAAQVTIKTYTVQGKLVNSMQRTFPAGAHSVMPGKTTSGVHLFQVFIGERLYTLQQVNVGGIAVPFQNAENSSSHSAGGSFEGPAKSAAVLAAFPDTIVVIKTGYIEKRVEVTQTIVSGLAIKCAPVAGQTCANPVFVTSATSGGWSNGGYYVHNNMWNCSNYQCAETLYACSYHSWYVDANLNNNNGDGAVKTYPNVHKDYNPEVAISSFNSLTSTFAATSPHVGIYDVSYDIWTNGVATAGCTEFMIWTENYNQVPAGNKVATVTLSGRTYNVWKTSSNGYIAFIPTVVFTSGTLDILEIFKWTMSQGWLAPNSTLGQLDFGVEIVSTNSTNARFNFTDFSITGN